MENEYFKKLEKQMEYEIENEFRKWADEIPFIKFPENCEVKIIPPFGGAITRFLLKRGENTTSIYLDCYDRLGIFGSPYYEVYPYNGDTYRCGIKETNDLLSAIEYSLTNR